MSSSTRCGSSDPLIYCDVMADCIELWSLGRASLVLLEARRMTIGRGPENDITIADAEASAIHAALEPLAGRGACAT